MSKKEIINLQSVLNDKTLLALMRFKYIPLSYILLKCGLPFNTKNAIDIINDFGKLNTLTSEGEDFQMEVVNITAQFQIINAVIHVSIGIPGSTGKYKVFSGPEVIDRLQSKEVSINTFARDISSEFGNRIYKPFFKHYEAYDKVVKDCEKSTNLASVLVKHGLSSDEWKKMKASISRYGLNRDIHFAKEVLVDGLLVNEITRRFLGRPFQEVVLALLKGQLSKS